jgi:hypothetical protein
VLVFLGQKSIQPLPSDEPDAFSIGRGSEVFVKAKLKTAEISQKFDETFGFQQKNVPQQRL